MTATITKLYDSYTDAYGTIRALIDAGIPSSDISMFSNNPDKSYEIRRQSGSDPHRDGSKARKTRTATGAGIGAALGSAAGLLAGIGILAVPGIGLVVAAGWLASTFVGAVTGGAAGGVVGALTQLGMSEEDAHLYAEGVRRGGTLVSVRTDATNWSRVDTLLSSAAVDTENRRKFYHSTGWNGYDAESAQYTAEQIQREREAMERERF